MGKISDSEKSDLTLIAALCFLLLLYLAYNIYFERGGPEPQDMTEVVMEEESPGLTQR